MKIKNFTIGTWNVNSIKVRVEQVKDILQNNSLDVLAIQETKTVNEAFPYYLEQTGYNIYAQGQKQYNGVATFCREEADFKEIRLLDYDEQKRAILTVVQGIAVVNVYVPNGSSIASDKYEYKLAWLHALKEYLQELAQTYEHIIVLGDFNIAPSDLDVHANYKHEILVSPKERNLFQEILDLGFKDTFRQIYPDLVKYSWWDYRSYKFTKTNGMRIDFILASNKLSAALIDVDISSSVREHIKPSDHTLCTATFSLPLS